MTEETDVSRLVEHSGMVPVVNGIGIVFTSVGRYVMSLAGFLDIAIHDDFTIDGNGDVVALYADFLFAPLAQRLVFDALGWDDAIDGAVHLIFTKASIDGVVVVKYLALAHTIVGSIDTHRSTDTHTIVDTWA